MTKIETLLTDHMDIWTSAIERKSTAGRGRSKKFSLYGIEKLRALILDLAVRGRLVPQHLSEGSASDFLSHIKAHKQKLTAQGVLRKSKILAWSEPTERPISLPQGWTFATLGAVAEKLTDGSHNPPSDVGSGLPMLSSQNIAEGRIAIEAPSRWVSEADFALEDARTNIRAGDVLLTIVASIGRSAVVPDNFGRFTLQRSVAVIASQLFPKFLCLLFHSPVCSRYMWKHAKGTAQKGIYLEQLSRMTLPIPPLAEQHRIVAKVDELMALCDALEAGTYDALAAHTQLVKELLATLTTSANAEDFPQNWARIETHFHTLFTTEDSIDHLERRTFSLSRI